MKSWVTLTVLVLLLAGCAAPEPSASTTPAATTSTDSTSTSKPTTSLPPSNDRMRLVGLVTDVAYTPLEGIQILVAGAGKQATTDAKGEYVVADLPAGAWLVTAQGDGFRNVTTNSAAPTNGEARLDFVLERLATKVPYHTDPVRFKGYLECAAEAFIVSGSCDYFVQAAGQRVFQNDTTFGFPVDSGWATAVLDFSFDLSDQPLIDAMRLTVKATGFADELGEYQQFGRFSGPESFTVRLEPGNEYPDATAGPVTQNVTAFSVEVFPQGQAYHTVCDPSGSFGCFLGAGAGLNVEFELAVTVFYYEPAPADYTLLGSS